MTQELSAVVLSPLSGLKSGSWIAWSEASFPFTKAQAIRYAHCASDGCGVPSLVVVHLENSTSMSYEETQLCL